jgi:membrane protease YdiL (CAAX protease family)
VPGWGPFSGLTLVVLCLLLGLARLSQRAVEDPPALPPASETPDTHSADTATVPPADTSPSEEPPADGGAVSVTDDTQADARSSDGYPTGTGSPEGAVTDEPANREFTTGALLANVALTQGLFGAVVAVGAWYYEIPATALGLAGGPVAPPVLAVFVGLVFGVVLWVGNELAASAADAVGAAYDETLREMLAPDSVGGWVLLLAVILPIIAGVEELIFRAALIGVPAAGFDISPWLLAVLSSIAFALGHGAQGRVGIVVTGGLGFVLAAGYVVSGSLLVVVVAHYLVNALEFLVHEGAGASRLDPFES